MTTTLNAPRLEEGPSLRVQPDLGQLVRILISLAAAVTLTAIAATTGDFWVRPEDGGYVGLQHNLVAARVVIFTATFATVLFVPPAVLSAPRFKLVAIAGWLAYLSTWLLGQWPGLVEPDTTEMLVQTRRGVAWEWFSWIQSLLNFAALDLVPHVAVLGVIQILLMATLLGHVTWLVRERSASLWPAIGFCVVAGLSVPLISYSIHLVRDTLFAIGHVWLALLVARAVADRRLDRRGLTVIVVVTAALSAYRGDGPLLLLVVPAVLLVALRPPRRDIVRAAAMFTAAAAIFHVVFPAMLAIRPDNPHVYGITLRLNPLGAVLQSDWYAEDPDRVRADLSRVIDIEKVKALQDPVNIPAYWDGTAWRYDASEEDWQAFESATTELLLDNPGTFLANRARVFLASSGMGPGAFRGTEYIYPDPADRVVKERPLEEADIRALTASPPSERLYDVQQRFLHWGSDYRGAALSGPFLHWNLVPWIALLSVALVRFRRWPFEATVALIILCRLPLVALVAPIAQFKYYNSVHLGGLVVLGLLLARVRPRVLRSDVPRPAQAAAPVMPAAPRPSLAQLVGPKTVRLASAALLALLLTLLAATTGDWGEDWAVAERDQNLPVARAVLFLTTFTACWAAPVLVRRATRTFWVYFGFWSLLLGSWLVALWPGIVVYDTVVLYHHARQGVIWEWFSYIYGFAHLVVLDVWPSAAAFGVLQVVLTAGLLAYVAQVVTTIAGSRVPALLLALATTVSIPLVGETTQLTRDTLFGVLHVLLAVVVARAVAERALSPRRLVGISLLTGVLSTLRGDGMVLLVVVPLLLLLLRPRPRSLLAGAAVLAGTAVVLHVILPGLLSLRPVGGAYGLTLVLNPLGAVLQSDAATPLDPEVERDLSRAIDVGAVRETANPLDLAPFWGGHWNREASDADWEAFNRASRKLLLAHPGVVLRNQFESFWAASNMAPGSINGPEFITPDPADRGANWLLGDPPRDPLEESSLSRAVNPQPPSQKAYDIARSVLIAGTGPHLGPVDVRRWHWNVIPALLLLAACLLAPRRRRFEAVFAAVILSRVPLVFLLSPVAQFKYYYSVYLGGIVVAALLLARLPWNRLRGRVSAVVAHPPEPAGPAAPTRRAGIPELVRREA